MKLFSIYMNHNDPVFIQNTITGYIKDSCDLGIKTHLLLKDININLHIQRSINLQQCQELVTFHNACVVYTCMLLKIRLSKKYYTFLYQLTSTVRRHQSTYRLSTLIWLYFFQHILLYMCLFFISHEWVFCSHFYQTKIISHYR